MTDIPIGLQVPALLRQGSIVREIRKNLGHGQLTGSNATLYTAPSGVTPLGTTQYALLKKIILCNTDSTLAYKATLYLVESGGTAAANRAIMSAKSIAANDYLIVDFGDQGVVLESGWTVQGLADTTLKITYTFDGAVVQ